MKKILLLGGSAQQIVAIETAKRLGFYTALCDYLDDNPGQFAADKFYLVSTTDKEAVLKVAESEKIDGVIAYASDPAAPTAAFIAEKMGLPTNPYKSVETLCNKDRFREFLKSGGFDTPKAEGYTSIQSAVAGLDEFNFPIIIKPVDSSGSKGATVLHSKENVKEAIEFAFSFSREKRIVVEEFIEKKHKYLIGGDVIIENGKIVVFGLLNCHRDNNVNPLVPVGKSYPLLLEKNDIQSVRETLQKMVDKLQIKFGAMNVELIIDKNNRVFPIDIGPRSGGNMIPDLLGYIFNIDVVELTVKMAMGMDCNINVEEKDVFYATHNIHSAKDGVFKKVEFSPEIEKFIIKKCIYKTSGDKIERFENASKAIGIVFFKFNNAEEMKNTLDNINSKITVVM